MRSMGLLVVFRFVLTVSVLGACAGCGETGSGAAGMGGTGGEGGSGGTAGSEAPVITKVAWNWTNENCMVGTSRAVTVTVSATDEDTEQLSLTYRGNVSDCTPEPFDGNVTDVSILDCDPNSLAERSGTVTVTDPEDNSDSVTFEFQPCESGQVCEGGEPCE